MTRRDTLIAIGLVILAIVLVAGFWVRQNQFVELGSNLQEIDFELLAEEIAATVKADDGKLYNFMPLRLDVDRDGKILGFSAGFMIIRNDNPIHFQSRNFKNHKVQIVKSWDVGLSKEEVLTFTDFSVLLSFINRVPWEHLEENITTNKYDYLSISNFIETDGEGNHSVFYGTTKFYKVNTNEEIMRIPGDMTLPLCEYQALSFTPMVYYDGSKTSARGGLEVQYIFKVK
jgi:hypothetical protein